METSRRIIGVIGLAGLFSVCLGCAYQPTPMHDAPAHEATAAVQALRPVFKERFQLPVGRPFREWSVADTSADSLARIGDAATPSLIEGLADPNPMVRALAARSLARMGSRAHTAVPALIIALEDEDVGVRRNAARALGQIGPEAREAVPALMRALRDPVNQTPIERVEPEAGAEVLIK